MSHLERDILKGKFGKNKELKKEAREENAEEKVEKKTGKKAKVREIAGKMKVKKPFDMKEDLAKYMHEHRNDEMK